jgi:glyoxylase-like metal-dependent hydrolase (beta-lactamase superfamily II)
VAAARPGRRLAAGRRHARRPAVGLTPGHTEEDATLLVRAAAAVYARTHLRWRGDRTPVVDPLAWDQAKLEEGRARLLAGGVDIVIPGHGEPFRLSQP